MPTNNYFAEKAALLQPLKSVAFDAGRKAYQIFPVIERLKEAANQLLPAAPGGAQAPGSAWDTSLPGFGSAVWSLGELIRVGIAQPLAQLNVTGVCRCNGCSTSG